MFLTQRPDGHVGSSGPVHRLRKAMAGDAAAGRSFWSCPCFGEAECRLNGVLARGPAVKPS